MYISISGTGTSLVFIHGYCEDQTIWHDMAKSLSTGYQTVLVDLPGHGKSPLLTTNFSIEDIADQVHDALAEKGIRKFFVTGHSLGGYVGLALAELYPESVIGFGLFSSSTFADDEMKKKARDKVGQFIAEHGVDQFIEPFIPKLIAETNHVRLTIEIESLVKIGKNTSAESIVGYAQAMKNRPDRTVLLNNPKRPVFVIAGEHDTAVPLEASEKMIDLIDDADALILKGTGHNGYVESPDKSLSFIKDFLKRHSI